MNRCIASLASAVFAVLIASPLLAADLFWKSGTGILTDANYTDTNDTLTPLVAPQPGDVVNFGAGGTATFDGVASFGKLRVGHTLATAGTLNGTGTVTIESGAQVSLTGGASGIGNAALWVGHSHNNVSNGILNIDNATLTANQLVVVGYGNNVNRTGTINITNGGNLNVQDGNLTLAEKSGGNNGAQGYVNMSGADSQLAVPLGHLIVGNYGAKAGYSQTGGTATVGLRIIVGQRSSNNSSFMISGGSISSTGAMQVATAAGGDPGNSQNVSATFTGTSQVNLGSSAGLATASGNVAASLLAGSYDTQNTSVEVSGDSTLTTSNVILIGVDNALNSSLNVKDNAILNAGANITIGNNNADGSSLTISDLADINAVGNIFIGRATSKNTTFTMTGGTLDTGNQFLMGTALSPGATNIVANHSGGTITSASNFTLADTYGESTYNLSGTGTINAGASIVVGRRNATGIMNQTGGTVTAAQGIRVGDAFSTDTAFFGQGIYNASGGTITANQTTDPALSVGFQGTGTFRVIGDDATIDVNGNMTVNSGGSAQGTLAFQLETDDLLSLIDVSGTARFNKGAMLVLDDTLAAPTQTFYDLLTAPIIADIGISFTGPAGWGYQIVPGGNGQVLRVGLGLQPQLPGDHNDDGTVDAADYVVWRKTPEAHGGDPGGYDAYRQNFGNPPGSGSSLDGAQVPEPACLMLVVVGAAALVGIRRR